MGKSWRRPTKQRSYIRRTSELDSRFSLNGPFWDSNPCLWVFNRTLYGKPHQDFFEASDCSSNTVFAGIFCEATSLAAASAASLYMTPVCDFTLPMCVARPASSLTLMSSAVALIRSLWRWCLYL